MPGLKTNLLYFGDNLEWLSNQGHFPDESVDLVYLDPPFNSNRNYNVLFKESDVRESEAQIHAFEDTWHWDREGRVQEQYNQFVAYGPDKPGKLLRSLVDALGFNDVTAYLTMMAPRLVEMHRVLKPTGSLYLHCDPTASHYLKVMLDSIFGPERFVNEIVWKRSDAKGDAGQGARHFGRVNDSLLFYSKGPEHCFNALYAPLDQDYVGRFYRYSDPDGRRYKLDNMLGPGGAAKGNPSYEVMGVTRYWRYSKARMQQLIDEGRVIQTNPGTVPMYKRYLDESRGTPLTSNWTDISLIRGWSGEKLGYPTQKPLALLERIINASSNPGDVVLDPFCGCGTAVHAAQKLGRQWIGIDITPMATDLIRRRMEDAFPGLKVPIEGWPADFAGARSLAGQDDKYHFQDWAVIQAGGRPAGGERRKGADRGVDGVIPFIDGTDGPKRGIISVKAGNTGPTHVRDLAGVVTREPDATFGVFICLNEPTRPMVEEALSHGSWTSMHDGNSYPVIQILSAQDLVDGKLPRMPQGARVSPFARAARERNREGTQGRF